MPKNDPALQRNFFNALAEDWRNDAPLPVNRVAELCKPISLYSGARVLDVACGTGVLDEYLLQCGCKVVGLDISPLMIERAKQDPSHAGACYYAEDFHEHKGKYDLLLVFDAYPHFCDKTAFARAARELLSSTGKLWIFFDQSREQIDAHHLNVPQGVSVSLLSPEEEAARVSDYFSLGYHLDKDWYYLELIPKKL